MTRSIITHYHLTLTPPVHNLIHEIQHYCTYRIDRSEFESSRYPYFTITSVASATPPLRSID